MSRDSMLSGKMTDLKPCPCCGLAIDSYVLTVLPPVYVEECRSCGYRMENGKASKRHNDALEVSGYLWNDKVSQNQRKGS